MESGCQIDFYVLAEAGQSPHRLACRLALMAWEQGHRVAVLTSDENEAESLDEIMWESPAGRFLPHARGDHGHYAPVSINLFGTEVPDDRDLVINLADTAVSKPGRFRRLLEIVPAAERQRQASRRKFRAYREMGLKPVSHTIGK